EQTESVEPFAVFSDEAGDLFAGDTALIDGAYTLTVTAFAGNGGSGRVIASETLAFNLASGDGEEGAATSSLDLDSTLTQFLVGSEEPDAFEFMERTVPWEPADQANSFASFDGAFQPGASNQEVESSFVFEEDTDPIFEADVWHANNDDDAFVSV
ncbi:MAG: hypothetical protein AAF950_04605, partial [Pseudomonadota bacterium]